MRRLALLLVVPLVGCSLAADPTPTVDPCPEDEIPTKYESKDWGRWIDADGDCQDTRQEVLVRDSVEPVTFEPRNDRKECRVATGKWIDPYDGREIVDPSKVDVDHLVAKKDAHESGGWVWSYEAKRHFTNDMGNLKATSQSMNRSKGSRGPDEWLPPLESARCSYIVEWTLNKESFQLTMAPDERAVIDYMVKLCDRGDVPDMPQG